MITQYLPLRLVEALGFTLLHALWQGAVFAIVLALLLVALRKYSPQARYIVAIGMMGAFALTSGLTFRRLYTAAPGELTTTSLYSDEYQYDYVAVQADENYDAYADESAVTQVQPNKAFTGLFERFGNYYDRHLPLLVTLWLIGVLVMQLRWLGQLGYVQRLKHYGNEVFPDAWSEQLRALEAKLRIRKTVRYALSPRIDSPMVMGWLQPMILFPRLMFEQLNQTEIYAVLAHELAHVRREDFIVNLLQSLLTNVFFFHPGVWWMSSRADEEREQCCDDLAVAALGGALPYAKTLINVSELALRKSRTPSGKPATNRTPAFAMGFEGSNTRQKRGGFAARLKRLFGQETAANSFREGFATACILFGALIVAGMATSQTGNAQSESKDMTASESGFGVGPNREIDSIIEPHDYDDDMNLQTNSRTDNGINTRSEDAVNPGSSEGNEPYDRLIRSSVVAALNSTIVNGDHDLFEILLAEIEDINARDMEGYTPLSAAAHENEENMTRRLLARGANVEGQSREGWSALTEAADEGAFEVAKILIKAGANVNAIQPRSGISALDKAADNGHLDIVKLLVENGANIDGLTGDQQTKFPNYHPPLHRAANEGNTDILRYLLDKGVKINQLDGEGRTALMYAASEGQGDAVALLMSRQANTKIRDRNGRSAAQYAAAQGNIDLARTLALVSGETSFDVHVDTDQRQIQRQVERQFEKQVANPEVRRRTERAQERASDRTTGNAQQKLVNDALYEALYQAVADNDLLTISSILQQQGIDVNHRNKADLSPLMMAAIADRAEAAKFLLERDADAQLRAASGKTAFQLAIEFESTGVIEVFREFKSKRANGKTH